MFLDNNNIYVIPTSREDRPIRVYIENDESNIPSTTYTYNAMFDIENPVLFTRNYTSYSYDSLREAIEEMNRQPMFVSLEIPVSPDFNFDNFEFKPKNINRRIMK